MYTKSFICLSFIRYLPAYYCTIQIFQASSTKDMTVSLEDFENMMNEVYFSLLKEFPALAELKEL